MSALRRFIVDTDTGSDDVWAIIAALRATELVQVEAITVVCGNLPLDLCVKNAMLAVDVAGTYLPPVYRGMERPLLRKTAFYAEEVHGADGLGDMNLPPSPRAPESLHAVDAIIRLVMEHPGEIEIATCGPLTNLAMAYLKEPKIAALIRKVYSLGGSAGPVGNATPEAEYNVYVDPEAASIVLDSGMDITWVTWDTSTGASEITPAELARMENCGSPVARFCARCTSRLRDYHKKYYNRDSFGVIDSMLMLAALRPELMRETYRAHCAVELSGRYTRGHFCIDRHPATDAALNATICPAVDAVSYKNYLFELYGVDTPSHRILGGRQDE